MRFLRQAGVLLLFITTFINECPATPRLSINQVSDFWTICCEAANERAASSECIGIVGSSPNEKCFRSVAYPVDSGSSIYSGYAGLMG